uniref:Uncharacterized protein n=1 Tax=Loa loa TaxID=7209 RepID=A0A1I7VL23_LOALO
MFCHLQHRYSTVLSTELTDENQWITYPSSDALTQKQRRVEMANTRKKSTLLKAQTRQRPLCQARTF